MRIRSQKQLYIKPQSPTISFSKELLESSELLESLPRYEELLERVQSDLNPNYKDTSLGRRGMTAEQVLRASVLKSRKNYSYRQLSHATNDSMCEREFLKIPPFSNGFSFKTLQVNISKLSESTLNFFSDLLKEYSVVNEIEDGSKIRTDATAIASNIHHPTDSRQLHDSIRVLSRLMTYALEDFHIKFKFQNHYRASKKKLFIINNNRQSKRLHKTKVELLRLCLKTIRYAKNAVEVIQNHELLKSERGLELMNILSSLQKFIPLSEQVHSVAYRREVLKEDVPSSEKIFSIFEDHTDMIVKGKRDIIWGHKSTITTGASGLILDVQIHDGNPADSKVVNDVVDAHIKYYKTSPKSMVFDGCYNSEENRKKLIDLGVQEVSFSKESDDKATCSKAVRKSLRFFRAGIEATVSILKRMFGWTRVMNKGRDGFNKALKTGAIAYNLFILSRLSLKS